MSEMPLVRSFTSSPVRQYAFIDERSRFRYPEAFEEHGAFSSGVFLYHVVEKFPYAIAYIQTDTGSEFTNRRNASKAGRPARLEKTLSGLCIRRKLIRPLYAPPQRQSGAQSPQRQRRILRLSQVLFFRCLCRSACPQTALLQQLPPAPPHPTLPLSGSYPASLLWNHIFV